MIDISSIIQRIEPFAEMVSERGDDGALNFSMKHVSNFDMAFGEETLNNGDKITRYIYSEKHIKNICREVLIIFWDENHVWKRFLGESDENIVKSNGFRDYLIDEFLNSSWRDESGTES